MTTPDSNMAAVTDHLLSLSAYVDQAGTTERTVRRWLADGRLPGAVKRAGQWWIPADARPVSGADSLALVREDPALARGTDTQTRVTLAGALDYLPAYLPLTQAAHLLGVTEYTIRAHKEHFQAVPLGPGASLVVPAFRVRQLAGI